MAREAFDRELQRLQKEILILGSEVEENLVRSVSALISRNRSLSYQLVEADLWVNRRRIEIGMDSLVIIATQQPAAGDMRLLAAVIEITGELERIHDYVKGIGKINLEIDADRRLTPMVDLLPDMAEKTRRMLTRSLQAFATRDAALAREVPIADDEVDSLYKTIYREIVAFIMANPESVEYANMLLWALHNLERAADRVTNICEWVLYMIEGEYVELDSEIEAPPSLSD